MRSEPRRSVVIHGHFYQPPREDPWTGDVPREPSAAPFHDWNRRIHDECYRAVVAAHVLDGKGRIRSVVNTLDWISWDAGPTLLRWMARETPDTYRAFLAADARSAARLGHGNALASPYHHIILPLASRRDKVTEVRWGITDFRRRFGRSPEGMWLPEAAVDTETLEVLAAEGIAFTILGPGQVASEPDGGRPGRVKLPSGREIAVFVYDGGLSHDVAFGDLIKDGSAWVQRIAEDARERALVALATDGETFGHHRRWGDMALAAVAAAMQDHPTVRADNFAAFLEHDPPREDIELVEPSSWSCAHGVERWRSDCGCRIDTSKPKAQGWRAVLRDALDELSDSLHGAFEAEGRAIVADPWAARDAYGQILDRGDAAAGEFVRERATRELSDAEVARAVTLLEMQHDALAMFTSCGWFFDDIAGLEPLQVLRYAARALDLAGDTAAGWEERLRTRLAEAVSADPEEGDGARLWDEKVRGGAPAEVDAPSGDDTVGVARALVIAVQRFVRDPGGKAASGVVAAAEAAETAGIPIPFEAQAHLGRNLARLRAAAPAVTRRVALRLGFSEKAMEAVPVTAGLGTDKRTSVDADGRSLFVDRVLPAELDHEAYAHGDYEPLRSWSEQMSHRISAEDGQVVVSLSAPGDGQLDKRIELHGDGRVVVTYRWDASAFPPDAYFAPELSFRADAVPELVLEPPAEATWRHEIRTTSGSEGDPEGLVQGVSVTPLWRCAGGEARISFSLAAVTTNG
ncbi:MAG: DUF3536 domain-containing protein [Gemmatimonadetes bacterium]|nr:DUF3536 domain-containing protein [Gemmatimonadota bacterium]